MAAAFARPGSVFGKILSAIRKGFGTRAVADARYKPEKHYMRGPGPKSSRDSKNK